MANRVAKTYQPADLGRATLRSDGRQLGIVCPDCSDFLPMGLELHLVQDTAMDHGFVTARLKVENMDEITDQFRRHVVADPGAHPSFATPVTEGSIG
jgi:hypothetical protein